MTIDLEEFRAWVARQSGEYDYMDLVNCPLAQFLHHVLNRNVRVAGTRWRFNETDDYFPIPVKISDALAFEPRTFLALLERLT